MVLSHCYKISQAKELQRVLNNIIIIVFIAFHLLECICSEKEADRENIGKIITAQALFIPTLANSKSCELDSELHINILCT